LKHPRFIAALATASVAALALTGCTGGGGSSSSGGGSKTLAVEDYYTQPNAALYDKVYKTCASSIGAKVTSSHVAGAGLIAKVLQQSSSKTLPDVLMLDNPDVQQIAASGALSPLKDYGITTTGYAPAVAAAGSYKGELYAIAPAINSLALFYNVDILKKAGITPPKTWDELRADAKKLTKPGQYGFAFSGINTYEGSWQFMPWMWSNGGDEKNLDTPQVQQGLDFLKSLVDDGSVSKSVVNWAQNDVNTQFTAGKAAMMENGPWNITALKAAKGLHFASVPLPTRTSSQVPVAPLGGETYTVPETGDKTKMALAGKFVKCVTNDANQKTIANAVGDVPAKESVAAQVASTNPLVASFATTVKTARARTGELGAGWPKVATQIYTAEQLVLTGKASSSDAIKQALSQ
jgi:multiple sugar transport system substrate-binding protein